jgi:hypothetical protein
VIARKARDDIQDLDPRLRGDDAWISAFAEMTA